ncbi:MAG: curli production assembly/transport component CsgF [Bacteroidota bacterium]
MKTNDPKTMAARCAGKAAQAMLVLAVTALFACAPAVGQDLIYQPKNPAFGGSPLNYQWMLSSAQLQSRFEEDTDPFGRDPLADFENNLQRQILSQLSRELIANRFGDLDLTQEGRFDLGDFTVEILPGLDGVNIRIINLLTGDESTVTIPSF